MSNLIIRDTPTAKEQVVARTRLGVTKVMNAVAGNDLLLHSVVAGGPFAWRLSWQETCRDWSMLFSEDIANAIFAFFCHQVRRRYVGTNVPEAAVIASKVLDEVEEHTESTEPDFEIDSGSSPEGRRFLYGPDGDPDKFARMLNDAFKDEMKKGVN